MNFDKIEIKKSDKNTLNDLGKGDITIKRIVYETEKGNVVVDLLIWVFFGTIIYVTIMGTLELASLISSLADSDESKTTSSTPKKHQDIAPANNDTQTPSIVHHNTQPTAVHNNEAVVEFNDTDDVLCVTNNEGVKKYYQVVDKINTQENIETKAKEFCESHLKTISEVLSSEECIKNYQENNQ